MKKLMKHRFREHKSNSILSQSHTDSRTVPHVAAGRRSRRRRCGLARRQAALANRCAPIAHNCEFEPTSTQLIIIVEEVTRAGRTSENVTLHRRTARGMRGFCKQATFRRSRTYIRESRSHVGTRPYGSGTYRTGCTRQHDREHPSAKRLHHICPHVFRINVLPATFAQGGGFAIVFNHPRVRR